jgi:hypothetical protein
MAVTDKIRKIHNTVQSIEPGPGCVGFWVDSENRVKFKDDRGNIYIIYDPTAGTSGFGTQLRLTGTFDESDTLSLTFARDVSVSVSGTTVTFASGDITSADIGRVISWSGFSGVVASLDSDTTATVFTISGLPGTGSQTASIGDDMDDALFEVTSIVSDAMEIHTSGNKSATGFDVYSSNPTSTATVVVTVIR